MERQHGGNQGKFDHLRIVICGQASGASSPSDEPNELFGAPALALMRGVIEPTRAAGTATSHCRSRYAGSRDPANNATPRSLAAGCSPPVGSNPASAVEVVKVVLATTGVGSVAGVATSAVKRRI